MCVTAVSSKTDHLQQGAFYPGVLFWCHAVHLNINLFCLSVFGSVEYEMLRTIKFLQQLDFFAGSGLGYFRQYKDRYKLSGI